MNTHATGYNAMGPVIHEGPGSGLTVEGTQGTQALVANLCGIVFHWNIWKTTDLEKVDI